MQSYLFAITALLLGCGALGLRKPEPTEQDVKLEKGIFEKLASLKGNFETEEEFWTSLFTDEFFNVVANTEVPGLVNISAMAKKALSGMDDKDKAPLTVRAAFLSMLGAADTYSDFNDWWDKSFDADSMVSVDAYVKELGHLLKLETPLTGQEDLDLETVYTEESRREVANLTDYNSDGFVHRDEAQNFAQVLNDMSCKGMAAPKGPFLSGGPHHGAGSAKGGILPERACDWDKWWERYNWLSGTTNQDH